MLMQEKYVKTMLPRAVVRLTIGIVVAAFVAACQGDMSAGKPAGPTAMAPPESPNILLILVDDLGYADLGVTGSEIRTPNIDALAREGVLFTDFHVTPVCFATRASLMTGVDHHTAGMGALAMARAGNQKDHPAYAGQLSPRVATLAELLRDRGYHTYMAGKWDLGAAPESRPERRGFERSWALMEGGGSHFSDASGLVLFQRGAHYREDGRPATLPPDFYSSTFYTDQMIRYLDEQPDDGRPYFAYAAYTAPHWPLQVPDEWLDRYAGMYDAGYEELARQRVARMKTLGLVSSDVMSQPLAPQLQPWATLEPAERREESRRMEIYAAMIELLDQEVGRLLARARRATPGRDTLVVFLSDNGPEGNSIDRLPLNRFWIPLAFDNSPENLGRAGSYAWYGAGWAQASASPFRLYKAYPGEGGYRVPAIIAWPEQVAGERREPAVLTVTDLTATLLDVAGAARPGRPGPYAAMAPLQGRSFRALLMDSAAAGPNPDRALALELFGRKAVRRDRWKALSIAPPFGKGAWELFDLEADPGERRDLVADYPQVLAGLIEAWDDYASNVGVRLPEDGESAYGNPQVPADR